MRNFPDRAERIKLVESIKKELDFEGVVANRIGKGLHKNVKFDPRKNKDLQDHIEKEWNAKVAQKIAAHE